MPCQLVVTWGGYKNNKSGFDRGLYYTLGDCGWSCDMMMMSSNDWGGFGEDYSPVTYYCKPRPVGRGEPEERNLFHADFIS